MIPTTINIIDRISYLTTNIINVWQMVIRRSLSNVKLLFSVIFGVLLASSLMSGTVIYFDALREVALKSALEKEPSTSLDIVIQTTRGPTTDAEYRKLDQIVLEQINEKVAWMAKDLIRAARTPTMLLDNVKNQTDDKDYRTYFAFIDQIESHLKIEKWGRMPRDMGIDDTARSPMIEAIVPKEIADRFNVSVGDVMTAIPTWSDDASLLSVVVSGLFTVDTESTETWYLASNMQTVTVDGFNTVPFYVSEKVFLNVIGPSLLKMDTTYYYLLDIDETLLDSHSAIIAGSNIASLGSHLGSTLPAYIQTTVLDDLIRRYDQKLFFSKLPMFMILVLIVVVILYYVSTLSALIVDDRKNEIVLLKSRGANSTQVLFVFVIEGLSIAAICAFIGPVLALVGIKLLGITPAFADLTDGSLLNTRLSINAFGISALGGIFTFLALVLPAISVSRIGVITHKQELTRPSIKPFYHRYYLDVMLLVVMLYMFRQLTRQGSVVITNFFGETAINELAMLFPGIALLVSALVLLRVFPLLMNIVAKIVSNEAPAGIIMGIWNIGRSPAHYARVSLLLILTAGLGMFASSFGATLDRSFEERVLHSSGSDIRIEAVPSRKLGDLDAKNLIDRYEAIEGVEQATAVLRQTGQVLVKAKGLPYEMFAMQKESFQEIGYFRDDYSSISISDLFQRLDYTSPFSAIDIPSNTEKLIVKAKPDRPHPGLSLTLQTKDNFGRYISHSLGKLGNEDWTEFEIDIRKYQSKILSETLSLKIVSLRIHETGAFSTLEAGSFQIDEIRVTNQTGIDQVLDSFEDVSWTPLLVTDDAVSDSVREADSVILGQKGSIVFSWSHGASQTVRGIFKGYDRPTIPVLASKSFSRNTGHLDGEIFEVMVGSHRVKVKIVGIVDYFPTFTRFEDSYLISNITDLSDYVNLAVISNVMTPNQIWVSTGQLGDSRRLLIERLDDLDGINSVVYDRVDQLTETRIDPLINAGWKSLLFVSFFSVLLLSCVGVVIHAFVSYKQRLLQFALMRTVGTSVWQLISMVWLEQILILGLGIGIGSWIGGRIGSLIMPLLGHDDWGDKVIPPFVPEMDWMPLLMTYGLISTVFVIITLTIVVVVGRISVHSVLRLGDS